MSRPGVHPELSEGLRRFNGGRFWDAHEAWEQVWLRWPEPERRFVQGLIQLAAAWHHVARGNERGARRLFAASLTKLREFPRGFLGIDRDACEKDAANLAASHVPPGRQRRPPPLIGVDENRDSQ